MGTRSRIGVMHGDKLKSVYCHWDGYLEHNGRILQDHYDSSKANHLVALGDLSSLGAEIGEKHDFDNPHKYGSDAYNQWQEVDRGVCTFYGRDRNDTDVEFRVSHTFDEFLQLVDNSTAEYFYIMRDGVWYCGAVYDVDGMSKNTLYVLSEMLAKAEA